MITTTPFTSTTIDPSQSDNYSQVHKNLKKSGPDNGENKLCTWRKYSSSSGELICQCLPYGSFCRPLLNHTVITTKKMVVGSVSRNFLIGPNLEGEGLSLSS